MDMRQPTSGEITYAKYPDLGCDVSPSCFTCPLPACKYDDHQAYLRWVLAQKWAPVQAMLETRTVSEVAQHFGLMQRTVYRIKARKEGGDQ